MRERKKADKVLSSKMELLLLRWIKAGELLSTSRKKSGALLLWPFFLASWRGTEEHESERAGRERERERGKGEDPAEEARIMRHLCNRARVGKARGGAAMSATASRVVTTSKDSRIGKKPVLVGKSEVKVEGQILTVKGPLGTLTREFPPEIALSLDDDKKEISFTKTEETRKSKQLHGLCRSLGQNMVTGVVDGWEKKLSLIGVGYRAAMKGSKQLELQLGYIHPVVMDLPEGVKAEVDKSNSSGWTPLYVAMIHSHPEVAAVLRDAVGQEPE